MKTHKLLILTLVSLIPLVLRAQVGFDNPNPHPSSVVDINSSSGDKGVLLPRVTTAQRLAMATGSPAPAQGLLLFDTDKNRFYFWTGVDWQPVNVTLMNEQNNEEIARINQKLTIGAGFQNVYPDNETVLIEGSVAIGSGDAGPYRLNVQGSQQVTADLAVGNHASVNTLNIRQANGPGLLPPGSIIIWSGNEQDIPAGFALCDGQNGRPDLRNRFIVGAGSGSQYAPRQTGGADVVTLTQAQTPLKDHNHYVSLTTSTNGLHRHNEGQTVSGNGDEKQAYAAFGESLRSATTHHVKGVSRHPAHWVLFHAQTDQAGNHSHTVTGHTQVNGDGSAAPHENRPPFYALCYIIKL